MQRQSTIAGPPAADPAPTSPSLDGSRHRFRTVEVRRVRRETDDAVSLVLGIDPADEAAFAYRPGQFVTVRVALDGGWADRSYSMSSAPGLDPELQITVKRVPGGVVSTFLHDHVRAGDRLEVRPPAGTFVLDDSTDPIVAFAAGSGITPIHSIVKAALAGTDRPVTLCYANRDRASTIFADHLDALARRHPDRFELRHHHDAEAGLLDAQGVRAVIAGHARPQLFVCGPTGFMAVVEAAAVEGGIDADRLHLERFTPLDAPEATPGATPGASTVHPPETDAADPVATEVTIRLGSRRVTTTHRPGTTILQAARQAGLRAPSSCETGTCATCMARLTEGEVAMRHNEALTPGEVAEGWILTCQSVPTSPAVTVVYE